MSQELIDIAKATLIAYGNKDWDAVKASLADDAVYDEVATHQKVEGAGQIIEALQGWAKALPDSKATFHGAVVSGNTVTLEMTWNGTHTGPLGSPKGEIPATGKSIEVRACAIVQVEDGKQKKMTQYFDMMTFMQQLGLAG